MMSDEYIKKQCVIEEINNLREHIPDSNYGLLWQDGYACGLPDSNYGLWQDGYSCGLSDAYSAISNIKSPWISTRDKFPNDGEIILIVIAGTVREAIFNGSNASKYEYAWDCGDTCLARLDEIDWWMPLPKAPEVNKMGEHSRNE